MGASGKQRFHIQGVFRIVEAVGQSKVIARKYGKAAQK